MKKVLSVIIVIVMMLSLCVMAFAANVSLEQAKLTALHYAGVNPADASFTKVQLDYENGLEVYEFEFCAYNTEYAVDIDAYTGSVVKFSPDCYGDYFTLDYSNTYGDKYNGNIYYWDKAF